MSELTEIKAQAKFDREYMYELGEKFNMSEKALSMFRHFNWIEVTLMVDLKTGLVHEASAYQFYCQTNKK